MLIDRDRIKTQSNRTKHVIRPFNIMFDSSDIKFDVLLFLIVCFCLLWWLNLQFQNCVSDMMSGFFAPAIAREQ